jgi:hypothetical protein
MKKHLTLLLSFLFVLFIQCDTNDDGFYNHTYVDVNAQYVTFSNTVNYNVNDYFVVQAQIPRLVPEIGSDKLLDIYKTTGNATQFAFSYVIQKKVNDTWETVSVNDEELNNVKGEAFNGAYVYGLCNYNNSSENYEYEVGFPLKSTGNYRVSFGYNSDAYNTIELRSVSNEEQITLNINSLNNSVDNAGYFYFNVN